MFTRQSYGPIGARARSRVVSFASKASNGNFGFLEDVAGNTEPTKGKTYRLESNEDRTLADSRPTNDLWAHSLLGVSALALGMVRGEFSFWRDRWITRKRIAIAECERRLSSWHRFSLR
jgi:hypothetical protein